MNRSLRLQALFFASLILALVAPAQAVLVDGDKRIDVTLSDGTAVTLYAKYVSQIDGDSADAKKYYYLPPKNSLRLGTRSDGTPKFLFVKYTTDKTTEAGGVQGGLMHLNMEWSMTPDQEAELRNKIAGDPFNGELMGAIDLEQADETGSFRIVSATLADEGLTRSLVQSGNAPTMPGGEVAVATNLSPEGAQLFMTTVEDTNSIADLSVELDFAYKVMLPAAKGTVTFNWLKISNEGETIDKSWQQKKHGRTSASKVCVFRCFKLGTEKTTYAVEESDVRNSWQAAIETGAVDFKFEAGEAADPEYVAQVQEAMFQYFLNSMMKPAEDDPLADDGSSTDGKKAEGEERNLPGRTRKYTYNYTRMKTAFSAKTQTMDLDMRLPLRKTFQVVGNMASWYDSVKDNPSCVTSANLDDPFFKHREIRFIMDLDAKAIFEDMVNYVTVNVKKKRSGGETFDDSMTIDAAYLAENGIVATTTYARGEDRNSEVYQYQTQWSLRGGHLFPPKPRWQKGSWEGVTLAAPIERWDVEVEGDLQQMEANDIARVTVEMHYPTFGEEKYSVVALSPRKEEPLASVPIYVDSGTRGFAYRLIIHHKKEGRMALPWESRIGDRYVYANIPEELLTADSELRKVAKETARKMGKAGAEKVLDEFQELFADAD